MLAVHVGAIQDIELTCKTWWEIEQPGPWEIASHLAIPRSSLGGWRSNMWWRSGRHGLDVNITSWMGLEGIAQSENRNRLKEQSHLARTRTTKKFTLKLRKGARGGGKEDGDKRYLVSHSVERGPGTDSGW